MVSAIAVALGLSVLATPAAHAAPVGGTVTGTVTSASTGQPIPGLQVQVNGGASYDATTNASGEYEVTGIEPGDYTVYFAGPDLDYVAQYWPASLTVEEATRIEVTDGTVTSGIDAALGEGATISGRVVTDADPTVGIPNLQVSAGEDTPDYNGVFLTAYTDPDGYYTIRGVPAASYRIWFFGNSSGYADEVWNNAYTYESATLIPVPAGGTVTGINAAMAVEATVSGRVVKTTDPSQGIEGVQVQLSNTSGQVTGTQTDASGNYTVTGIPAGTYTVQFQGASTGHLNEYWDDTTSLFEATPITLVAGQAVTGVDAALIPAATIQGRVTSESTSEGLSGVWVYANSLTGGYGSTTTDMDGNYSIGGLLPGDYRVNFNANTQNYLDEYWDDQPDYEAATLIPVAAEATVTGIDAALADGSTISGNVKGDDGTTQTNLANVQVTARTDTGVDGSTGYGNATTDSNGDFTINGLVPGDYQLEFDTRNTGTEFAGLTTEGAIPVGADQDIQGFDVVLGLGGRITGTISGSDAPAIGLEGMDVMIRDADEEWYSDQRADVSAADGTYTTMPLPAGSYWVTVGPAWDTELNYLAKSILVTIPGPGTVTQDWLLDPGGVITGTVTGPGGVPLEGALVTATGEDTIQTATTDEAGAYTITELPTGTYTVSFRDTRNSGTLATEWWQNSDSVSGATEVDVVSGKTDAGIDAQLGLGATISGRILDEEGDPVAVFQPSVRDATTNEFVPVSFSSDASDGSYSILGLPVGTYKVGFTDKTFGDTREEYDGSGELVGVNYAPAYLNGKTSWATADVITVTTAGQALTGYDVTAIELGAPKAFTVTPTPTISGALVEGRTLTATAGDWVPAVGHLQYRWLRDGVPISFATDDTYDLRAVDVGHRISVQVSGTLVGYEVAKTTSVETEPIVSVSATVPVPTISGDAQVGEILTAQPGTWGPGAVDLTYQWTRDGVAIPSATASTYQLAAADLGALIAVVVSGASDGTHLADSISPVTAEVVEGTITPGTVSIDGTSQVGLELTADVGTWDPADVTFSYVWQSNGAAIDGETASSYTPTADQEGKTISLVVTGSKAGYTDATANTSLGVVVAPASITAGTPTISGTPVVDGALTVDPGTWDPEGVAFTYQWAVDGEDVVGATDDSFTPRAADVGSTVTVTVTGSLAPRMPVTVTSAATAAVAEGMFTTAVPTISGTAKVGETVTASVPAWTPAATALSYQWKADGSPIGTDSAALTLTAAEAGATITVTVTGTRDGYTTASATSIGTSDVALGDLVAGTVTISGTPVVDGTLTAHPGTWSPAGADFTYQWAVDGENVTGETGATFSPRAADVGLTVTVTVTGSLSGYVTASATSAATAAVAEGTFTTVAPTISGTAKVGETLTASVPAWTPEATLLSYQWKADGSPVGGDSDTLTLTTAEAGATITVTVTGTRDGYATASATSAPTSEVATGDLVAGTATISGTPVVDGTLTADPGTWSPSGADFAYQWSVDGADVVGATAATYSPKATDVGLTVTVTVTGTLAGYVPASATSAATAAVAKGTFTTAVPTISGTAKVGETLTASVPAWTPEATQLSYQWKADGSPIGTDSATMTLTAAEAGATISVTVTGERDGYTTASATSVGTSEIAPGDLVAGTPTISGTPAVGGTLTVHPGTWSPTGTEFAYQWAVDGVDVADATGTTFTPRAADVGKPVTVTVTGSLDGFVPATEESAETALVAAGALTPGTPTISGTPVVDGALTADPGTWSPSGADFAYQWAVDGEDVAGATGTTFTPRGTDAGLTVTVTVTGSLSGYAPASATSAPTSAVAQAEFSATAAPTISGTAKAGETLTASVPAWTPEATQLSYQWKADGSPIGADSPTLVLTGAETGATITVTVTGARDGYAAATATSAPTGEVETGDLVAGTATISGTPVVGGTLTAHPGTWSPEGVGFAYQWAVDGENVAGATGATFTPRAADVGLTVTVTVTGSLSGYAPASASSAPTSAVTAAEIAPPTRLAGDNRFDTAVAISSSYFEPGVARVYVANGYGYPDALSAAPAAAHFDAPLLLTEPKSVPAAVLAEIDRLKPAEIVIVGGTGVVTDAVKNTLAALSFDPEVRRIGGLDRYATSRALAEDTWDAGEADTAYLATGWDFPDALSASPAAAHFDGPVVLVPGTAKSVDATTRALLSDLGVERVKLAGGTGVISSAIESQLKGVFGAANVIRNGGLNRYLTSVAINADEFDSASTVYLATGSNYADALAGAALAGTNRAPLFTTLPNCVPQAVLDAIDDLGATNVVLLGGTGVLTPAVENLTSCG
jgi:putative cell wall-binding protein